MRKILTAALIFIQMLGIIPAYCMDDVMISLYVSTQGDDKGKGTENDPFASLERARKEVRKYNKNMNGNIVVNVEKGTYFMKDTFVLTEEDSGSNGYKVIWQGDDMETIISGGRKINGFILHKNDIYKVKLPEEFGNRMVTGLYIDGKEQQRAGGRVTYKATSVSGDVNNNIGYLTPGDSLKNIVNPTEMQVTTGWSWIVSASNVKSIGKDYSGNYILSPEKDYASGLGPKMITYRLHNDYSFIEKPGDFCYVSSERTMYYKKPENVNLDTAEIIVPYLDFVFKIQGKNALSKAENIEINGFSFSHCEDTETTAGGFSVLQSIQGRYATAVNRYPDPGIQTSSVWVNNAENITIKNNRFNLTERGGLGLYEGVTNSVVDGNVFCDLANCGLTVGLNTHRWIRDAEYGASNVAYLKNTTTSNGTVEDWRLVDDDADTECYIGKDDKNAWIQIDLEKDYSLNLIEVYSRSGKYPLLDFEVWGSNQENFLEYKVIAKPTEENPYTAAHGSGEEGVANEWQADISGNKFRYIRLINPERFEISDIRIFSEEEKVPSTTICEKNIISNNIFTRVANFHANAAHTTLFYVADTEVVHNEFYGAPYSAISIGWGWSRSLMKTMKNNKVNYNYINGVMIEGYDGGGIYSLGIQQNEEIKGNYIKNQMAEKGAVYPDNGSNDILIAENVAENVPIAYFPYSGDQYNLRVEDNWASTPVSKLGAPESYIKNTRLFVKGHMPDEAKKIADFAGLEDGYEYLYEKANEDRNTTRYDNHYSTAHEQARRSYNMSSEGGVVPNHYIEEAKMIMKIAMHSGLITEEKSEISDKLKNAIKNAKILQERPEIRANAINDIDYEAQMTHIVTAEFREVVKEFIDSVFTDNNYSIMTQNIGLEDEVVLPASADEAPLYEGDVFNTDEIFVNKQYLSNEANIKSDNEKIQFSNFTGYLKHTVHESTVKTRISLPKGSWPGLALRSQKGDFFIERDSCYLILFKEGLIELQRFDEGKQNFLDANIPIGAFKFGEANDVEVTMTDEETGVRIVCYINGELAFDKLDTSENAIRKPGFIGFVLGVSLYPTDEEGGFFNDLDCCKWATDSINSLYLMGIISGRDKGVFGPVEAVTRAELAKLIVNTLSLDSFGQKSSFSDVKTDDWYYKYVAILENMGAYDGVIDEKFESNKAVTMQEACAIISAIFEKNGLYWEQSNSDNTFTDIENIDGKLKKAIYHCVSEGIVQGYNEKINPTDNISRAQVAVMMMRLYNNQNLIK